MIPTSTLTRKAIKDMNPNRIRILIDMLQPHAYPLPKLVSKHATTLVVIPMKSPPCTSIEPMFKEILLYASARNAPASGVWSFSTNPSSVRIHT